MDDDRRSALQAKRAMLLRRRERQRESLTFRAAAARLCTRSVRFSKLPLPRQRAALGRLASGPGRDERLVWEGVSDHVCRAWSTKAERDALVREALAHCASPDAKVAVIWHTSEAALSIRAGDLAEHVEPVLEGWGDTVWLVASAAGPWLIEIAYWDREVCWSRHMPDPAEASAPEDSL